MFVVMFFDEVMVWVVWGSDFYVGVVDFGVVVMCEEVKYVVFGVMYGVIIGDSGCLVLWLC